jgi:hypothetical protein
MNDDIAARNRANAQKSTGPRTAEGKAVVAMNARRHGATGRPDRESVANWLAVILDRPEITLADLMPGDDAGYRALALAQAEARLVATERALRTFEAGSKQAADRHQDNLQGLRKVLEDARDAGTLRRTPEELALMFQALWDRFHESQPGSDQHRLLQRYSGRRRRKGGAPSRPGSRRRQQWPPATSKARNPDSRNKARFHA